MSVQKYLCPECNLAIPASDTTVTTITCPFCDTQFPTPDTARPPATSLESVPLPRPAMPSAGGESQVSKIRVIGVVGGFIFVLSTLMALMGWFVYRLDHAKPAAETPKATEAPSATAAVHSPTTPPTSGNIELPVKLILFSKAQFQTSPDLELAEDPLQPKKHCTDELIPTLPDLMPPRLRIHSPEVLRLDPIKQDEYKRIVEQFILYDIGRLSGTEGQKALENFQRLGEDAIPALVHGANNSADMNYSCPIIVIRSKLSSLLQQSNNLDLLTYARDQLGKGRTKTRYQHILDSTRQQCEGRVRMIEADLSSRIEQVTKDLKHKDPVVRQDAANTLAHMGSKGREAIPALVQSLKDPEEVVRLTAARSLVEIGSIAEPALLHAVQERESRPAAAAALTVKRPLSEQRLKAIVNLLKRPEREQRCGAHLLLIHLGKEAIPGLMHALSASELRCEAAYVLGCMGSVAEPAIPILAAGMKDPDKDYRMAVHHALVRLGSLSVPILVAAVNDSDARVWYSAMVALGKIGRSAEPALPTLTATLKDPDPNRRILALSTVMKIKPDSAEMLAQLPDAVPALIDILQHEDKALRAWSAGTLGKVSTASTMTVPALTRALRDPEVAVCARAAESLGKFGSEASSAVPDLIALLKEFDPRLRGIARTSLVQIGLSTIPALVQALDTPQEDLWQGAGKALADIGQPTVQPLLATFRTAKPDLRLKILQVMQWLGPKAKDAVPTLLEMMNDSDFRVRLGALQSLGAIDADAPEIIPVLLANLNDSHPEVSKAAQETLVNRKLKHSAVAFLRTALKERRESIRCLLCDVFKNMGSEAKSAVPSLTPLVRDTNRKVRLHALQALDAIDRTSAEVVAALVTALNDDDEEIRKTAQESLTRGGSLVVPALVEFMKMSKTDVRLRVLHILQKLGPDARDNIPAFLELAKDPDSRVRAEALHALREIDPAAPAALLLFIDRFKDQDTEVRIAAHLALLTASKEAIPHLLSALKRPEVEVRRGAAETLKKIAAEGHARTEIRAAIGDLLLSMKDPDRGVRDGAGWALGEIDPELKAALPLLVKAVTHQSKGSSGDVTLPADLSLAPLDDLCRAADTQSGARLRSILLELKERRSDRVLVALAKAIMNDDAEIQKMARLLLFQYLTEKPNDKSEEQARIKLNLAKQLLAENEQRYREIIQMYPHTLAAEEARRLLKSKK